MPGPLPATALHPSHPFTARSAAAALRCPSLSLLTPARIAWAEAGSAPCAMPGSCCSRSDRGCDSPGPWPTGSTGTSMLGSVCEMPPLELGAVLVGADAALSFLPAGTLPTTVHGEGPPDLALACCCVSLAAVGPLAAVAEVMRARLTAHPDGPTARGCTCGCHHLPREGQPDCAPELWPEAQLSSKHRPRAGAPRVA